VKRILDLFCGGGGCSMGYHRAGLEVVGVDLVHQPRYPFEFHQADALDVMDSLLTSHWHGRDLRYFDAIHASPPCQAYSTTASLHRNRYPELIGPVLDRLLATGLPYVIENVVGAPLNDPIMLCGSSFGLGVRRHRLFETSPRLLFAPRCAHELQPEPIDVTGTGGPGGRHRKPRNLEHAREAMGIDWMTRPELSEAVPPAYTEWIGTRLLAVLEPLCL
jgi:DNA (cytosine-5)-methyltransferase 1